MCWLYNPDFCEGHYCPKDCDNCPTKEEIFEAEEDDESDNVCTRMCDHDVFRHDSVGIRRHIYESFGNHIVGSHID